MPADIFEPGRRDLIGAVVLCCLLALVLQYMVFRYGFLAASADESARALIARDLSWDKVFVPNIWPPFYDIVVGLSLRVVPDLFYTPRLVSTVFGLMTLLAMAWLAFELFQSRLVAIVTAFLAVFLHHRLLLSVAPMSEVFFNFFVAAGMIGVVRFLRRGSAGGFVAAAAMFMLSGTVRFEGWFCCAAFVLVLGVVQLRSRPIGWAPFLAGTAIACAFPLLWIGLSLYQHGDLSGITAARDQNRSAGIDLARVARNSHLSRFLRDQIDSVLLAGSVAALALAWSQRHVRIFLMVAVLGLVLASAAAVASHSNPLAAPWRIAGAWTGLLIPFTAYALVWLARRAGPRAGRVALPLLALVAAPWLLAEGWRIVKFTVASPTAFAAESLALRDIVGASGAKDGDKVLIDISGVDFLHLVVAINRPEAMVYSAGTDPVGIALYVGQAAFWREDTSAEAREIYDRYISLKVDFAAGPVAMAGLGVRHVLVKDAERQSYAGTLDWLEPRGRFGEWMLFECK